VRFLLRPSWLALSVAVIGFAVACYALLAPWQFRRNDERSAQNQAISASFAAPAVPLGQLVAAGTTPASSVEWRLVTVTGRYLPDAETLARLRSIDSKPAFEVLTPLRTTDGRTVMVDRGYIRPVQGSQVPGYAAPPAQEVTLTARVRADETDQQGRPAFNAEDHRQVYAVDSRTLAAATGLQLERGYLQLTDAQPGGLGVLPLPEPDAGPFLSYAWQWLVFGAFALFGLVYFARLEVLQRRQRRADLDAEPDGDLAGDESRPAPAAEAQRERG
jgi:cytochrome oxidase assembly protein ShyY1